MINIAYSHRWDKLGMAGSGLCVLHCLALPFMVALLPGLGTTFLADERAHQILGLLLTLLAALAFVPGYRRHGSRRVLLLMATGLGLILLSGFGGERLEGIETLLSVAGSFSLIAAHFLNHTFCKTCPDCKNESRCPMD